MLSITLRFGFSEYGEENKNNYLKGGKRGVKA